MGVDLALNPSTDLPSHAFSIDLQNVPYGIHDLYVRSRDDWSITHHFVFYKAATLQNINKIEYFIDNDPGLGFGTPVVFPSDLNIQDFNININLVGLSSGQHRVFIRSKDLSGKWSLTNVHLFNATVPLAVDWLMFDAYKTADNLFTLLWQVSKEINVAHYMVQHSLDGQKFFDLAKVLPNSEMKYTFLHTKPSSGLNYYRITELDTDGTHDYSDIRSLYFGDNGFKITVYDHPSHNVNISVTQECTMSIFDTNGHKINSIRLSANEKKPILSLPSGTYIAVCVLSDGSVLGSTKLIFLP
jgi:hypothetical protein